ncbi:hypothetical protein J2X06_001269 [Lysobacter niastensis]|uniref:Uncharacterized protein n=1 Tax=Lysobacter niastensis TaxID=380629 RepID=A0ABU1W9V6_9GAMM|nr:hypothetical protein [Lysobacter niastensis]
MANRMGYADCLASPSHGSVWELTPLLVLLLGAYATGPEEDGGIVRAIT